MISVDCPHCRATLRIKEELAGRRGKCPKCQAVMVVPRRRPAEEEVASRTVDAHPAPRVAAAPPTVVAAAPVTPVAPARAPVAELDVVEEIRGHIEPVPTSLGYKGAVLLVAIVMLLLPLVYVAIIAGVAVLLYLHAVSNTWLFTEIKGRGGREHVYAFLIYLAPLFAGGILLFFMCKPLFAGAGRREKPRSLTRDREPLLFAFVDRLCVAVGAAAPSRIDVDCRVNASASFRRGLISLFGKDMVLTVGLPLVAGMSLQQFAGVLAHEFGHFAQGWGMRVSYVIRMISHWFTRVVYERDSWDEWLAESARNWDLRVGIILHFSRLLVWLTRKVLWCLMMVGHGVSGLLLRQMEFDADLHEIRFSGSESFEASCRRLAELNVANSIAFNDLQVWYRESRLGDDLPLLIRSKVDSLPGELRQELTNHIDGSTTGWLDTHPADSERIAQARRVQEPGLFHDARPAAALFSDFGALSKTVTFDLYKAMLGSAVKITDLHSTEGLIERQERENVAGATLERYLLGRYHALRPLPFGTGWIEGTVDSAQLTTRIRTAREQMLALSDAYGTAMTGLLECDSTRVMCAQADALLDAGFKIKPGVFPQPLTNRSEVRNVRQGASNRHLRHAAECEAFEAAAAERMTAALEGVCDPAIAGRIPGGEQLQARCRDLLTAVGTIGRLTGRIVELRDVHAATVLLTQQLDPNNNSQELVSAIHDRMRLLYRILTELLEQLARFDYPFKHGRGKRSIAAYCTEATPSAEDLGSLLTAGGDMLDRLPSLQVRMMGQLSIAAENVEKVLGLTPLQPPAPEAQPKAPA